MAFSLLLGWAWTADSDNSLTLMGIPHRRGGPAANEPHWAAPPDGSVLPSRPHDLRAAAQAIHRLLLGAHVQLVDCLVGGPGRQLGGASTGREQVFHAFLQVIPLHV